MKWDIHIYDPKSQTTKTHVKAYPGTRSMADSAAVVVYASRDFGKPQKYILAVPHHGSHATKRKAPAQLDREIAAHLRPGYDNSPGAWQQGYDYAKETSRHETRAEQREVLRRVAPGASEYDRGYMAGYQDVLGIARKRSHATRKEGTPGYEVSRTVLGKTRSTVFTARYAAEQFQAAHEGSHLKEVQLDENGRIIKRSHATKKAAGTAIDTVHTLKMSNGRVITTTWHDTRAEANKRVKSTAGRDPKYDRVLPDKVLGNFKAVTWSY